MKRFVCLLSAFIGILACVPEQATQEETGEKTVHVTGISLDKTSVTIKEGESFSLEASVTPNNAENKAVFWSSSNDAVAKVSDGKVTGITAGSATITAKTEDGGKTASCSVTVESNLAPSVTVGADNISAISVILKGKANLSNSASSDLQVGFQYSKSAGILPSNSTIVDAEDADADYNYSTGITGLEPGTTYYFRSFVRQNGKDEYGETKEFKTKELSSMLHTLEASKVSAVSAKLNASLSLTDVRYESVSMGFYWGSDKGALTENVTASEEENVIVATLSELNPAMEYYFQAFTLFDGKEYKEEVVSLTTKDLDSILETKEASEIEATKATLNAKLDLTDVNYGSITYGFYVGTSESDQNSFLKGGSISDNAFTSAMTSLPHKTQYWYKAYVKLDSQVFYGEVKTFTTDVVPVESVSLDKTEYTFNTIGNTIRLNVTILPSDATDKSVEWTSSNTDVATVDQDGKVTAIGNGTTTIIVKTKDQGKTASCAITVAQLITSISLNKTSLSVNEGEEFSLIASVKPDNASDKTLIWSSSNESIATVDQTGTVTGVFKGLATITAEAQDGSGRYASCAIEVIRPVTSIELEQTFMTIYTNEIKEIKATVTPSDASNTTLSWRSSNSSIASIWSNNEGSVWGKSPGSATITARAASGVTASCNVEVLQSVNKIILNQIDLTVGDICPIDVSIIPEDAYNKSLIWTSDNPSVATVDDNGVVTAISKGKAIIEATAADRGIIKGSCSITISSPCPDGAIDLGLKNAEGYRLYWSTCNLGATNPEDYGSYYAWGVIEYVSIRSWADYPFYDESTSTIIKYNSDDNLTTLENEDDVARSRLGEGWRIPTVDEWQELCLKCSWEKENINGKNIRKVVSCVSGYTDKWIIIAPGGCNHPEGHQEYNKGYYGYYWSSSRNSSSNFQAIGLEFSGSGKPSTHNFERYYGLSVRPVFE